MNYFGKKGLLKVFFQELHLEKVYYQGVLLSGCIIIIIRVILYQERYCIIDILNIYFEFNVHFWVNRPLKGIVHIY